MRMIKVLDVPQDEWDEARNYLFQHDYSQSYIYYPTPNFDLVLCEEIEDPLQVYARYNFDERCLYLHDMSFVEIVQAMKQGYCILPEEFILNYFSKTNREIVNF